MSVVQYASGWRMLTRPPQGKLAERRGVSSCATERPSAGVQCFAVGDFKVRDCFGEDSVTASQFSFLCHCLPVFGKTVLFVGNGCNACRLGIEGTVSEKTP